MFHLESISKINAISCPYLREYWMKISSKLISTSEITSRNSSQPISKHSPYLRTLVVLRNPERRITFQTIYSTKVEKPRVLALFEIDAKTLTWCCFEFIDQPCVWIQNMKSERSCNFWDPNSQTWSRGLVAFGDFGQGLVAFSACHSKLWFFFRWLVYQKMSHLIWFLRQSSQLTSRMRINIHFNDANWNCSQWSSPLRRDFVMDVIILNQTNVCIRKPDRSLRRESARLILQ